MVIDDFTDDGLVSELGTRWRGVSDQVIGGISKAKVSDWSCHAYVPVFQLIYAAFRSKAKGLLLPSDEWRRREL